MSLDAGLVRMMERIIALENQAERRGAGETPRQLWARCYHTAAQTIANGSLTQVAFNSTRTGSTAGIHNAGTGALTAISDGFWHGGASIQFATNATGDRTVYVTHSTVGDISQVCARAAINNPTAICVPFGWDCVANDYFRVYVIQDSGGSLNVTQVNDVSAEFWVEKS